MTANDLRAGDCLTHGLLALWPKSSASFDRAVRLISAPQPAACKRAIHVYWQAMTTTWKAMRIYLPANQHITATELNRDFHTGTLGALADQVDASKARGIRVCG